LLNAVDSVSGARGKLLGTTDKLGKKLFTEENQVDDLLTLIQDVRAAQIELVEFRCCNLGAGVGLKKIHKLFGSRITAAPKVKYVWLEGNFSGKAKPPKTAAEWHIQVKHNEKRTAILPPKKRIFTRDDCIMSASPFANESEIVAGISVTKEGALNRYDLTGYFQDWESVKGWTQVFLENSYYYPFGRNPPGGGFSGGGQLYIIGFYTPSGHLPFVFPGDGSRFTDQIAYEM
jgi:hypothetical protein